MAANNQLLPGEVDPLKVLDEWEEDVLERYPDPSELQPIKLLKDTATTKRPRGIQKAPNNNVRGFHCITADHL